MAGISEAKSRTLAQITAKRKELQIQTLEIQIKTASDYTWFPLHPPLQNVEGGGSSRVYVYTCICTNKWTRLARGGQSKCEG